LRFIGYATPVALAGWSLAQLAIPLGEKTGLSDGVVGGIFTAVSTSVPELVVAITAVRMGALNLAVGDIIGGNAFDTLFVAASDIAYRQGPIYAAVSSAERFWLAISMTMTSVLLMGLIYRERHGPGNIGLESVILLALYVGAVLSLAVAF
jgi:cation:H+ antiporter